MRANTIKAVLASVLLLSGCGVAADDATAPSADVGGKADSAGAPVPSADWRVRVAGEMARLENERPERVAELRAMAPRVTRAGHLRFTTSVDDADVATVFLSRLAGGERDPGVRAALIEALPRTGGVFADALGELSAEPVAEVRAIAQAIAWRAPAEAALPVMRAGLADADAGVRAEAARAVSRHVDGKALAAEVAARLTDADAEVRAAAVRTVGIVGGADSDAVATLLADRRAEVRLEALRSLRRTEPALAEQLVRARELDRDPDARVRAAAAAATR
jgi:HEAT repeat protein